MRLAGRTCAVFVAEGVVDLESHRGKGGLDVRADTTAGSIEVAGAPPGRSASRTTSSRPELSGSTNPRFAMAGWFWGRVVADIPDFMRELIAAFRAAAAE